MLAEALASAQIALQNTALPFEMLVINNNSPDDTSPWLKANMPQVRVLDMPDNAYLKNLNTGMAACRYKTLMLLNNDMKVAPDYLRKILPHFEDPAVFAVTCRVMEWGRDDIQGHRRVYRFSKGWFHYLPAPPSDKGLFHGHATGGQSVFDLEKLHALGLNDMLLRPLYHEDLDVTYRAYKAGFVAHYEPQAVAEHHGGATSKKLYTPGQLRAIQMKNLFLFQWKNLHAPAFLLPHRCWLPLRLLQAAIKRDWPFCHGFFSALEQFGEMRRSRQQARAQAKLSDAQVFSLFRPV